MPHYQGTIQGLISPVHGDSPGGGAVRVTAPANAVTDGLLITHEQGLPTVHVCHLEPLLCLHLAASKAQPGRSCLDLLHLLGDDHFVHSSKKPLQRVSGESNNVRGSFGFRFDILLINLKILDLVRKRLGLLGHNNCLVLVLDFIWRLMIWLSCKLVWFNKVFLQSKSFFRI